MRLLRYTVVDPDARLAKEKPEVCVLLQGMRMLEGSDEKGLIMEVAERVSGLLGSHNTERSLVEYEDEDGKPRKLRPIRLGELDVVLEQLKTY